jgi:hypothetical protein
LFGEALTLSFALPRFGAKGGWAGSSPRDYLFSLLDELSRGLEFLKVRANPGKRLHPVRGCPYGACVFRSRGAIDNGLDRIACFDDGRRLRAKRPRHEIVHKFVQAFVAAQVANSCLDSITRAPGADAKLRSAFVGDEPVVGVEHFRSADVARDGLADHRISPSSFHRRLGGCMRNEGERNRRGAKCGRDSG